MGQASGTSYERLQAAAARLKVPDAVRTAAAAVPSDPEIGQIWRGVAGQTVQLLAVIAVADDSVRAVPLSLERFGDENTLLMPAGASTLEQPFALWWGLQQNLSWSALDRRIAQLTALPPPQIRPSDQDIFPGARWGTAVASATAPAAEFRASLVDAIQDLQDTAHWAPQGTSTLGQLLRRHHITAAELASHLGLPLPQALAMWRGQLPVTPAQARLLGELVDIPMDEIITANPALPPVVVHELNRPLRRWQLRHLAGSEDSTESDIRTSAAFEIFALAARQTGGGAIDWTAKVDRYFQMRLQDNGRP